MPNKYALYEQIKTQFLTYSLEELQEYIDMVYEYTQGFMGPDSSGPAYDTGHLKEDSWFQEVRALSGDRVSIRFGYDTLIRPPRMGKPPANYAAAVEGHYGFFNEALEQSLYRLNLKYKNRLGNRLMGMNLLPN